MVSAATIAVAVLVMFLLTSSGERSENPDVDTAETAAREERPNILFILTDDLDLRTAKYMPKTRDLLIRRGTTFEQAFSSTSLCCSARASILRGQYTHNHAVFTNHETEGGYRKFRRSGKEVSTAATWLDAQGYQTVMIGKYLNYYDGKDIPLGWDYWHGQMGRNNDHRYNENGEINYYPPDKYHDTDLFSDWAARYVRDGAGEEQPFFMYLSVNAPHGPAVPAPRHEDRYRDLKAPRTPSFNEKDVSDKPEYVRSLSRLSRAEVRELDELHRLRAASMLSVDDMVARLVRELERTRELENTYIFFTTDHGYHLGQHRLDSGKDTAYEEDVRIPLYVRGPGVPEGASLPHKVLNIDFAPTFTALAGAETPAFVDGRSLVPLLEGDALPEEDWRKSFLLEGYTPSVMDNEKIYQFKALRTDRYSYIKHADGQKELYELESDPYQLNSLHDSSRYEELMSILDARLRELRGCAGEDCRKAEDAPLE